MTKQCHSWRNESTYPYKNLYINAYCNIIHNSPKVHYPINKMVYTYNKIVLNQKSSEVLIQAVTWVNLENIILSKTSQSQRPPVIIPLT